MDLNEAKALISGPRKANGLTTFDKYAEEAGVAIIKARLAEISMESFVLTSILNRYNER